jgi:hypothetical protein
VIDSVGGQRRKAAIMIEASILMRKQSFKRGRRIAGWSFARHLVVFSPFMAKNLLFIPF